MKDKKLPPLYPSPSYLPSELSAFDQMLEDYQAEKDYQAEERAKVEAAEKKKTEAEEKAKVEAEEKAEQIKQLQEKEKSHSRSIAYYCEIIKELREKTEYQEKVYKWTQLFHVLVFLFMVRLGLFSPVTHRLSPDIGSDERPGQVTGFHYQRNSWWGFKKETFDRIRFDSSRGPQYLGDDDKWFDIPSEAWGFYPDVDDSSWYEQ